MPEGNITPASNIHSEMERMWKDAERIVAMNNIANPRNALKRWAEIMRVGGERIPEDGRSSTAESQAAENAPLSPPDERPVDTRKLPARVRDW